MINKVYLYTYFYDSSNSNEALQMDVYNVQVNKSLFRDGQAINMDGLTRILDNIAHGQDFNYLTNE